MPVQNSQASYSYKFRARSRFKAPYPSQVRICPRSSLWLCMLFLLLAGPAVQVLQAQSATGTLELILAPPEAEIRHRGAVLDWRPGANGSRIYTLPRDRSHLVFQAPDHVSRILGPGETLEPGRRGLAEVRLLPRQGPLALLQELETGSQPKSAVFSPDGQRIFVPLLNGPGIDVFQRQEQGFAFLQRMAPAEGAQAVGFVESWIDETRGEIWVSQMTNNRVHVFGLEDMEHRASLSVGGSWPKVLAMDPQGRYLYVSNWISRDISVIDPVQRQLVARIPVGGVPRGLCFSDDGQRLFVSLFDQGRIQVIDPETRQVLRTRELHHYGAARHLALGGGRLYLSDMARGWIYVLDAESETLLASAYAGPKLNTLALSPDGRRLYVSSRGPNNEQDYTLPGPALGSIVVMDALTLQPLGRFWGRNQPTGLALSPDGRTLAFTDFLDDNLEVLEVRD